MPAWTETGYLEYTKRMPREMPVHLVEVKAEGRNVSKTTQTILDEEAHRIRAALPQRCHRVVLDERGRDIDTQALARNMDHWRQDGSDVAFIIGGPDGLADSIKREAQDIMRLSALTLPHALVRPLLAEALYRSWTVLNHHPYHRN